ncbi:hypothetical protein SDC9_190551 [bioreactor metagenome]|uniref:Uncharacterized protein n=1 Tax=bioreactor metagenome TaxID=1076179 RepID=A0A645HWY8_9ZZZZ
MAGSNQRTFTAGKWTGIDPKKHRERRLINIQSRQDFRVFRIGNRMSDADILQTGNGNNIT